MEKVGELPDVSIAIIMNNDQNKILLGYRLVDNVWGPPGGKIDPKDAEHSEGDKLVTAVIAMGREVLEETGVEVVDYDDIAVLKMRTNRRNPWRCHCYRVYKWDGEIQNKEPDKCKEWLWVDEATFKTLPTTYSVQRLYHEKKLYY